MSAPLDWRASITDTNGRPSPEFQRKWTDVSTLTATKITVALGYTPVNKAGDTISGNLTVSGQLIGKGTATNNDASAGQIGEWSSVSISQGSPVALTSGVAANIGSVSLAAGDYDVEANICFICGAGASTTFTSGWVSQTSATYPGLGGEGTAGIWQVIPAGNASGFSTGRKRIKLASATTIYFSSLANFSGGAVSTFGTLRWRRPR